MRVPADAGRGDADITVSFRRWKAGQVLPLRAKLPAGTPEVAKSEQLRATLVGYSDWITSVAFAPDGKLLAAGCNDGSVKLRDVSAREPLRTVQLQRRESLMGWIGGVTSLAFSPNGETLAAAWFHFRTPPNSDLVEQLVGDVKLWDVTTGKELATLHGEQGGAITSLGFTADGKTLAGLEIWMKEPGGPTTRQARLWDSSSGKMRASIPGFRHLAFSPDSETLATWTDSSGVRIWETDTGNRAASIDGQKTNVTWLEFGLDGKTLLTVDTAGAFKRWDVRTGKLKGVLIEKLGSLSSPFTLGPGAKMCASVEQQSSRQQEPGKIVLWDLGESKHRVALRGHTGGIPCLAFSPDGKLLASGSVDKTVRLWKVEH